MSLFKNLARIVTAPVEIVDEVFVKPLAEVADDMVEGFKDE